MGMFDWLFGSDPKVTTLKNDPVEYPSPEAIAMAMKHGAGYGSNNAAFTEGAAGRRFGEMLSDPKSQIAIRSLANRGSDPRLNPDLGKVTSEPTPEETRLYMAAQLAANRSAVTGLGFDARRFNVDAVDRPEKSNLGGKYNSREDFGFANRNLDDGQPGSSLAHEATHRGFKMIRDDPDAGKLLSKYMSPSVEEDYVRAMNLALFGGKDPDGNKGIQDNADKFAKLSPDERAALAARLKAGTKSWVEPQDRMALIEALAADIIQKKNPRGPR